MLGVATFKVPRRFVLYSVMLERLPQPVGQESGVHARVHPPCDSPSSRLQSGGGRGMAAVEYYTLLLCLLWGKVVATGRCAHMIGDNVDDSESGEDLDGLTRSA